MPTTINLSVETVANATISIASDNVSISELKHIIEIYPLIKSKELRYNILGMIDGAVLCEDRSMMKRLVELTVMDYKDGL